MAELQIADVRAQVMLSLATDFENYAAFTASSPATKRRWARSLDQVTAWGTADEDLARLH